MTADNSERNHKRNKLPDTHALVVVLGLLTLLFALLSMTAGSRLSTLQSNYQKTLNETAESGLDAQKEIQLALSAATADLETAKKALTGERKRNGQLTKKMAAITKEMQAVKTDLSTARKTIEELQANTTVLSTHQYPAPRRYR